MVIAFAKLLARLWRVFLWKIPDIPLECVNAEFLGERRYRAEELNSTVGNAFSAVKLFSKAAKNFPLENSQVFLWNTRHSLYRIKTDARTDE